MDAAELQEAFTRAANEAGFSEASTEVTDEIYLKVRWVRTGTWIHLEASDYLLALSPEAAYVLAGHLMSKIMGVNLPRYPPILMNELMSDDFVAANQSTFLERLGRLDVEDKGDVPILEEYRSLAEEQGVSIPSGVRIIMAPAYYKDETIFPMMRVAIMPRAIARSSRKTRLSWIEDVMVKIGRGPGKEDAPEHYVEVA